MSDLFHSHENEDNKKEGDVKMDETCDCKNCAKKKKLGEHYENEGEKYCCEQCFQRGPIHDKTAPKNVCEFC
jgi:hypothetical protein